MSYEFSRNRKDALFIKTTASLAAGANSAALDLEQAIGGDIETIAVELELPAEALLSDAKVLTFTLQDSADGVSFAAVDPQPVITTQTGAGGVGVAAKTVRFRLNPATRRYIRVAQTVTATPGTLSGSFVLSLLF
jgi:hypothetical protein